MLLAVSHYWQCCWTYRTNHVTSQWHTSATAARSHRHEGT